MAAKVISVVNNKGGVGKPRQQLFWRNSGPFWKKSIACRHRRIGKLISAL